MIDSSDVHIPMDLQYKPGTVPTIVTDDVLQMTERFKHLSTPIVIIADKKFILYVVGTNHAIRQCQEDVATIIRAVKPQAVVLELCASRVCGCPNHRNCIFQTKPEFNYAYLKKAMNEIGTIAGMIFFADVYKERMMAEDLDFGGEMVRGMLEGKQAGSEVILGDRPITITMQRQGKALSSWKKIQLMVQVGLAMKMSNWKTGFLLRAFKIVFRDKKAFQVLEAERDLYLTYVMQTAVSRKYSGTDRPSIVAVVGQGHLNGIVKYWGKVTPQIVCLVTSTNDP